MIPKELADQVGAEINSLMAEQDRFLKTYMRLCVHHGGPKWQKEGIEMVFHNVRREIIPIMEQVGMDHNAVQALCSWAERRAMNQ
jgi:hypothetical protein